MSQSVADLVRARIGDRKVTPRSPETKTLSFDDLIEMATRCLLIDIRDVLSSDHHYREWLARNDLKAAIDISENQAQWRDYNRDPKGFAACPPYLDLWHWLLHFTDYENKAITRSNEHYLRAAIRLQDIKKEPEWVQVLMDRLLEPFGGKIDLIMTVSR